MSKSVKKCQKVLANLLLVLVSRAPVANGNEMDVFLFGYFHLLHVVKKCVNHTGTKPKTFIETKL